MKVGVIGYGFVGGTYANGLFRLGHDVSVYDPYKVIPPEYGFNVFTDVVKSPIIFVALPTIPKEDGSEMDMTVFEETLERIKGTDSIVVIKSTVLPGTTRKYSEKYDIKNLVFMPEFLTERTAMADFMTQDRIIFGTVGRIDVRCLIALFKDIDCPTFIVDAETAELTKFASNCLFATKVAFANEFYEIAKHYSTNWEDIKKLLYLDPRIGSEHLTVNETNRGFGGHCLPKDSYQLLVDLQKNKGFFPTILAEVITTNALLRNKEKWEA